MCEHVSKVSLQNGIAHGTKQHMIQRQKHRIGKQHVASIGKDFVSVNKSMSSSTSFRSKGKLMDEKFVRLHSSADAACSSVGV